MTSLLVTFAVGLIPTPGPFEMAVIAVIALLLFGKRLPDVARSVGRSITEFKGGLNDVSNEAKSAYNNAGEAPPREIATDTREAGVARFEPATAPDEAPVTTADAPTPEAGHRGTEEPTEEPVTSS